MNIQVVSKICPFVKIMFYYKRKKKKFCNQNNMSLILADRLSRLGIYNTSVKIILIFLNHLRNLSIWQNKCFDLATCLLSPIAIRRIWSM